MENPIINKITSTFSLELPQDMQNMDAYLDYILPQVRERWSAGLGDGELYLNKRWQLVKDDENFFETVLYIFQESGACIISIDGNLNKAGWNILSGSAFVLDSFGKSELYDLAFLNEDFLILKKHGDQQRKGFKKYFVLAREGMMRGLEWRDAMEMLYNLYRESSKFSYYIIIFVLIVAIIVVLSLF